MSLWDEFPSSSRDSGQLDGLRPLLDGLTGTGPVEETDADGTWRTWTATETLPGPLSLDPQSGAFSTTSGSTGTPIEFPDPHLTVALGLHQTGPGGTLDGGWRATVSTPVANLRLPFLRGAFLDAQGQLRADPANPDVRFTLPALRVRVQQLAGGSVGVKLLSASTGGPPVDQIYEFVRMEPPYALVGPEDVVGFAFRTAVLDLSGTAGPGGVPATARALPGSWQGLYLPEARLFVAPKGLEGIAVSAGVREMWIGIGANAGVTGIFEAEVVNRGSTPAITVRFATPNGEHIADPGTGTALVPEHATLFVDAAGGLAPVTVTITVDGIVTHDDRVDLTTPATGTTTITVLARDGASHDTARTFTVSRRAAPVTGGGPGTPVKVAPISGGSHRIVLESQSTTIATLRLEPLASAAWSWGATTVTGTTADVPVAVGGDVTVTATLPAPAAQTVDAFFLFDHPAPAEGDAYARNSRWTHTAAAASRTDPGASGEVIPTLAARLTTIGAATPITVDGYASYEGVNDTGTIGHNDELSLRRRDALVTILRAAGFTAVTAGAHHGHVNARDHVSIDGSAAPPPGDAGWWRARATTAVPATAEVVTARVTRPPVPVPRTVDPKPPATGTPDCFRKLGVRVELVRGTFIRAELYGEIDIETAAEAGLRREGKPALRQGPRNPMDGVCTFLGRLRIAEDRNSWSVSAEFRAAEGDLDGLAKMDSAHSNQTALDMLGALSVLAPLTSSATELSPAAGALVALGSVALGASDLMHTQSLILRGAELIVSDGIVGADGTTTVDDRGTQVSVLLDIEVAFTFDLTIVRVDPQHPITTRYKAIGVRSSWDTRTTSAGLDYVPLPVFDPSRGYSLDIPTGSLTASPPLDSILRVLGMKVSRDNPTYLEVEVGLGLDLGIVKVDTVRVRARLDGPPLDLQLTKLGATLDVPGTLHGSGYIEITPLGFKGAFDLTITPLNVRATASLAVESQDGVIGVLIGIEVEFPVPILLGNSGLGLFGILGGVGVNYARNEDLSVQVPALKWLQDQFARPGGVMDPGGWTMTPGHYAFAAGVLIGTVEGGYVIHLKGIVLIEVPGPRLLLIMKADVLSAPPALKSDQTATFLAVLDIDFGRGTITIGLVAEYTVDSLLKIRVPVTAFFDANEPEEWLVELGNYTDRVTVSVLDVITGSGYLMVHGNGVSIPGLPAIDHGLAVATGFHIQAVLMGSKAIGLYLEVAAGFDAILGLDPFFLAGKIYVSGELRLFIVSVGASAELTVLVGKRIENGVEVERPYVHGKVCGHVDLFFFEIEGCLELTIGEEPDKTPVPRDLVAGVTLISRSPAKVEGSGVGRSVDGKIDDARATASTSTEPLPSVPLDAIPVVLFRTAPTGDGAIVMGAAAFGQSGVGANPWTRIGDRWWKYELLDVSLTGSLQPVGGKTPATWWTSTPPSDPADGPALALLDWLPTPHPAAVPYGEALTTQVDHRWGTVCDPPAPAAPALWTFDDQAIGPRPPGWELHGIPWPDPPGTLRTAPVGVLLDVIEPWRCGNVAIDRIQGTDPAVVVGDLVPCCTSGVSPTAPLKSWQAGQPGGWSSRALPRDGQVFADVAEILASGVSLGDAAAAYAEQAWDPGLAAATFGHGTKLDCAGRVLRSPVGDQPEPAPRGTDDDRERVKLVWSELGYKPGELGDAVRLRAPGRLDAFTALLLVPERAFGETLVVQFRDESGATVHELRLSSADIVNSSNPIPAEWFDAGGPWADPVHRAGRIAARIAATARTPLMLALVTDRELPGPIAEVVIGWDRGILREIDPGPFYVVAMSGLVHSERLRASYDDTVVTKDREALSNALTQVADDHALLVPGETYTVAVRWQAAALEQDTQPDATATATWIAPPTTQSYRFAADPASAAPQDLAPWILTTAPGMGDVAVFCREPVQIALAHQKVAALFDAYGRELRVVVRSASGKHPEPPGGGSYVALPIEALGSEIASLGAAYGVTTPFIQAARELADRLPCISSSGTSTDTVIVTLAYPFEPLTDYLIDVHAVSKGAPAGATGLVHRIGFTTSRFDDVAHLARFVEPASVSHRAALAPGALQSATALPDRPTGDQLDTAFQAAGLTPPQAPGYPAVQVVWSPDPTPQPIAVIVECSEPLWRARLVPTVVTQPADASDPTHTWWAARPADWLFVRSSTTAPAAGDLPRAPVERIIRGPGDTRAIVLLGPGARGTEARIDLVVAADALAGTGETPVTIVRAALVRAPWEVED